MEIPEDVLSNSAKNDSFPSGNDSMSLIRTNTPEITIHPTNNIPDENLKYQNNDENTTDDSKKENDPTKGRNLKPLKKPKSEPTISIKELFGILKKF